MNRWQSRSRACMRGYWNAQKRNSSKKATQMPPCGRLPQKRKQVPIPFTSALKIRKGYLPPLWSRFQKSTCPGVWMCRKHSILLTAMSSDGRLGSILLMRCLEWWITSTTTLTNSVCCWMLPMARSSVIL